MIPSVRISKVEVLQYKNGEDATGRESDCICLYEEGEADAANLFFHHETMGDDSVLCYKTYPYRGEAAWSEEELHKIHVFVKLLFTFNGRSRLMKITDNYKYKDEQVACYTMNYFRKLAGELIENGEIQKYTVCNFDLNRYSVINEQIGRAAGTTVMQRFVAGLQEVFTEKGYICRLGGDKFVVLFYKKDTDAVISYLQGREIAVDKKGNKKVFVSASAGYYEISPDTRAVMELTDKAIAAMKWARYDKKVPYAFFDEELEESINRAKYIENIFSETLKNEEFLVYYQPKVLLEDYSMIGAEALCRWRHKEEIVAPFRFIPVLERSGLICALDFYMLEHVCKDIRRWLDEGRSVVKISVNMSRVHLGRENLLERILEIVDRYQIPYEYIEIELTETTTDVDLKELKQVVSGLREKGIGTSVDDFGVGYSSLNIIRELPWSVLKIDKSFLPVGTDTAEERQKTVMLKYVIAMAQELGMECIVEGVETKEQIALLKESNCCYAQGYYFDKPLPMEEFEKKMRLA